MRLPLHLAVLAWGGGGGRAAKTRPLSRLAQLPRASSAKPRRPRGDA
jgi:hypothetical protein